MTTSVQLTAPHGALDNLSGWQAALAAKTGDSSAPLTESDFHKVLKQGDLFSEDDDQTDPRETTPASRDRENGTSDSAYLFSDAIPLTPSRPAVQRAPMDTAPEPQGESAPDSQTAEAPAKIALLSATSASAPAPSTVYAPSQASADRRPADPAQSKTSSSDSQVTGDPANILLSRPALLSNGSVSNTRPQAAAREESKSGAATRSHTNTSSNSAVLRPASDSDASFWTTGSPWTTGKQESAELASTTSQPLESDPAPKGKAKRVANTIMPAPPSSTGTGSSQTTSPIEQPGMKALAPQRTDDDENVAQLQPSQSETKPERMADSATFTALPSKPSEAAPAQNAPDTSIPLNVPTPPLEAAEAPGFAHAGQRKASAQTSPPQSAQVAPAPELVSPSPAQAAVEDSSSSGDSPMPQKSAPVNAPAEWSVDNDESRVGAAGTNSSDPVVFQAKLTPEPVAPASAAPVAASPNQISAPQGVPRSGAVESDDVPAPQVKTETLFKTELPAPVSSAPVSSETRPAAAPQAEVPVATQMQTLIEAPAPTASSHAVTVNVRESLDDPGVNLRFVERGGEIHVSVRTSDLGLAQDLRGGLSDLTGRLEHAGIRTEISNLSAGESNSQRDAQPPPSDQRGSGRQSQDSPREQQEPRKNDPSAWREAIEDSTGASANSNQEQSI